MRVTGPRGGLAPLEGARLLVLVGVSVLTAMTVEDDLAVRGASPDFLVMALVYASVSRGAVGGSAIGFVLGLFRDTLVVDYFGLHALGFTALGYAVGKLRETVYLQGPAVDLAIVAGSKIALDVLVLGVAAQGMWASFETRFFWASPVAALYTAGLGAALYRVLKRS